MNFLAFQELAGEDRSVRYGQLGDYQPTCGVGKALMPFVGKIGVLARLPAQFWEVPYVPARFPGAKAIAQHPGAEHGANCQYYAYEVLRHFGLDPPDLRSSELWADTAATMRVPEPESLDLVLFNGACEPWGAHIGVHIAEDRVLHLCAEIGCPIVWPYEAFRARTRYRTFIGAKRVLRRATPFRTDVGRP